VKPPIRTANHGVVAALYHNGRVWCDTHGHIAPSVCCTHIPRVKTTSLSDVPGRDTNKSGRCQVRRATTISGPGRRGRSTTRARGGSPCNPYHKRAWSGGSLHAGPNSNLRATADSGKAVSKSSESWRICGCQSCSMQDRLGLELMELSRPCFLCQTLCLACKRSVPEAEQDTVHEELGCSAAALRQAFILPWTQATCNTRRRRCRRRRRRRRRTPGGSSVSVLGHGGRRQSLEHCIRTSLHDTKDLHRRGMHCSSRSHRID
jgi:hypothetical protein